MIAVVALNVHQFAWHSRLDLAFYALCCNHSSSCNKFI
jgi:hypothetical protein